MINNDSAESANPTDGTPAVRHGYPGRPELDAANMRFRRALARLHKEGARHDPKLLADLEAIVGEAVEHLLRLAHDAEAAEDNSQRHVKAVEVAEDGLRRSLAKAGHRGRPGSVALLATLDARQKSRDGR